MQNTITEKQISYIFSNMADAVCITAKNGAIYYVNNSAAKLFGFGESASGRKIWEAINFTEKNDALIQLFIDAVTQHKDMHSLVDYENNEGRVYRLHISVTYMTEHDGIFVVVVRDLTEFLRVNSAFARYTSPEIAKYVLDTPGGEKQGGSVRDVTILMSDLRGFTALSTKLPADTLITILNHYFEEMITVIQRWKGTLIEFLGDGIFVVFGAPNDDENHAEHAVLCALEMENAMKSVNEWNALNDYPLLEMGIGINSGPAVVGNIGSAQRMRYGCMGETVNLAGRVETFTVGGQIYISERTRSKISAELTITNEQSFMPKGASSPMKIFSVEGMGDIHMTHREYVMRDTVRRPEVKFFTVAESKSVEGEGHTGRIVKVSADEKYAVLESEAHVEVMQNILIDIGGSLYAKAVSVNGKEITLCFTSKPDGFNDWAKSLF